MTLPRPPLHRVHPSALRLSLCSVALLLFLLCTALPHHAQTASVVIRPREIFTVFPNPGMGITTFQRFNGEQPNGPTTWSEFGPVTRIPQASRPPDFPPTTIAYCRWYWNTIEPEPGHFRWDIIDLALAEAKAHGQRLAFRLMPYDEAGKAPIPAWYQSSGARRANRPSDKDGALWQPDFSDPLYLRAWGDLVRAAGQRYDGNPAIDTVDISTVGYWGEGWSVYMPPFSAQRALIDLWFQAFPRTHLLMNFDQPEALAYGTRHGAGWRLDCLGDMRLSSADQTFQPEMLDIYPEQIVRTGIQDVWEKHPVSLETCWTPAGWKQRGFDVSYILDQALRWHVSSLNIKSSPIPAAWKSRFDAFQRSMGYRFILRRLEYPRSVPAGSEAAVHMWWRNAGVAPIYRNYTLALRLRSGAREQLLPFRTDLRAWLPGDAVVDQSIALPSSLPPGTYNVSLALLDPSTMTPAIQLAVAGRQPDGWYSMGSLTIDPPAPR